MVVTNWEKSAFFIVGLILCVISSSIIAMPLQQENSDDMSIEPFMAQDELNSFDNSLTKSFELGTNSDLIILVDVSTDNSDSDLQNLKNSIYFEDDNKRGREQFYSTPNKEQYQRPSLNLVDEGQAEISLTESLMSDPDYKEKAKDVIESLKDVKELLIVNKEISYESSEEETNKLRERNLYQQEQRAIQDERGINKTVSKEKYDASVFREFFSKILIFALYAAVIFVLMKLVFLFVSWQRKVNKF